jgi:hypothetical protein
MSIRKQEGSYGVVMAVTVCMASAAVADSYHQKQFKNKADSTVEAIDASSAEDKTEV